MRIDPDTCRDADLLAAEVRRLRAVIASAPPTLTDAEREAINVHTINHSAYEGDIVSRLRNWRGLHLAHGGELFEEAADEIERLRQWGRLTDAEREAVEWAVKFAGMSDCNGRRLATLRGLLERTQCE